MRHKNKGRYLNRSSSHKKAMFYNLAKHLIKNEIIKTTLTKAKELRCYVEPLITLSKNNNLKNRREVLKVIKEKSIISKLFSILGKRYTNRMGGYTRILKYKYRKGDGAILAFIELVK